MSHFTKKVTKTYEFEGDTLTVVMNRLKKKDAIKIAPMLGEPDDEGNFKLKFSEQIEFMNTAGELLPKYIIEFSGLKDSDGRAIEIADICGEDSEAYFISLLSEIFGDLMDCSFAKGANKKDGPDEEKKFVKQQGSILEDTDSMIPEV